MAKTDKLLTESMGRRRPRETVQTEVADSILGELVPPTTIDAPLESLFRSPYQVRETGDSEDIDRLAESIQAVGLISPVVVRPVQNPDKDLQVKSLPDFLATAKDLQVKSFEIVTGHHRVLAALKLGWSTVPVIIKHMTDVQAAIALTADNAVKKDLTDWDRYQSILMLERTGACRTGREIATTLGISAAQVSQLRAFERLPSEAQLIIQTAPNCCGYKLAYELASTALSEQQPDLVSDAFRNLVAGKIKTQAQIVTWIHTQLAVRRPRAYRRELKIQRPGQLPIRLVVTESGATIDAQGLDPDRLAQLIEQNLADLMT